MTTDTSTTTDPIADIDAGIARLEDAVGRLGDGDLHRAHFGGGWTVAQVISHINLCTLIWLGDLTRLQHDPDLRFFFREEIGHDLTGYPPPTVDIARGQLASTRRTLTTAVPPVSAAVADRTVEIPDLGTMTVREWAGIIRMHTLGHVDQAFEIMRNREFLPEGF
jgi:hypothetical protein